MKESPADERYEAVITIDAARALEVGNHQQGDRAELQVVKACAAVRRACIRMG